MDRYCSFPSFSSRTNGNSSGYQIQDHPQASEGSNQSRESTYQLDHPQDSIGFNQKRKRVEEGILEEYALLKEDNNKRIARIEFLERIISTGDFPQAMRELLQRNAFLEEATRELLQRNAFLENVNNKLFACIQGRVNCNGNGPEFTPSWNQANAAEAGPSSSSKMVKPNHVVQGVDTSKSSRVKWDDQLTREFCNVWIRNPLSSSTHDGMRRRWENIINDFKTTTGVAFAQDKLKNKVDELRRRYKTGGQFDPVLQYLLERMFGNRVSTEANTMVPSSIVISGSNEEQESEISHQLMSSYSRASSEGGTEQEGIPKVNAISARFQGQEVYASSLPPMMGTSPNGQDFDEFDVELGRFLE